MSQRIYRARAESAQLAQSSKGNEQVVVRFAILDEGADVQHLTWYGYFTEKAFDYTIEALRNCGWEGDDLSDLTGVDSNEVDLVVEDETWERKTRAKVRWINKPDSVQVKGAMSPERAKDFASVMRQRIRALDAAKGARPTPLRKAASDVEDDLPF